MLKNSISLCVQVCTEEISQTSKCFHTSGKAKHTEHFLKFVNENYGQVLMLSHSVQVKQGQVSWEVCWCLSHYNVYSTNLLETHSKHNCVLFQLFLKNVKWKAPFECLYWLVKWKKKKTLRIHTLDHWTFKTPQFFTYIWCESTLSDAHKELLFGLLFASATKCSIIHFHISLFFIHQ